MFLLPLASVSGLDCPTCLLCVDVGVRSSDLPNTSLIVAADVRGELSSERHEVTVSHDMVDESEVQRFFGRQEVS
jgi:hypothetical protein